MSEGVKPHHVGLTVSDLERPHGVYERAPGFELTGPQE